jgi:hypothetical protein
MITKALNQTLKADADLVALVGSAAYFFAEQGRGDKSVVTFMNDKARVTDRIPDIMTSPVQVLISGFDIDSGEIVGQKVVEIIEALALNTITIAGEWQYDIKTVVVNNEPVLIKWDNVNAFSINFTISYRQIFLA